MPFALFLYRLLACLPLSTARGVGRGMAWMIIRLMPDRRRVAERNITACFPEYSATEVDVLVREHYRCLGNALADLAHVCWRSPAAMEPVVEIVGLEPVLEQFRAGRSLILMTPHQVDALVSALVLARYLPMSAMYKAPRNPVVDRAYRQVCGSPVKGKQWQDRLLAGDHRERPINLIEHRGALRPVLRVLKRHGVFFYLPDQDLGRRHAVFAPLFSQSAATVTAAARFATLGNADIVFCTICQTTRPGFRIHLQWLQDFPLEDEQAVAERINQETEKAIRNDPAQYFWVHKRFKTQPPGSEPFYR